MTQTQYETYRLYQDFINKSEQILERINTVNNQCDGHSQIGYLTDEMITLKNDIKAIIELHQDRMRQLMENL